MTMEGGEGHGSGPDGAMEMGEMSRSLSGSSTHGKRVATLAGRPTSATVGRRVSLGRDDNAGGSLGDSLEDTRTFYGLRPMSPQSSTSHRHPSNTSRSGAPSADGRDRSNSGTFSTSSRPLSPASTTATSPIRNSIPLPFRRSFLTPKKPKAAIKAEKEKMDRDSRQSLSTVGHEHASGVVEDPLSPTTTAAELDDIDGGVVTISAEVIPGQTPQTVDPDTISSSTSTNLPTKRVHNDPDLVDFLNTGPPDQTINHRHSITTAGSSYIRNNPIHSSTDDLVGNGVRKENGVNGHALPLSKAPAATKRRYESFENPLTTWLCGGYLMTGGDHVWSFLAAVIILLGITGVGLGTTGVWFWVHGSEYGLSRGGGVAIVIILVYLFGITASSLLVSAFRDPGIIPRGLDPDPPTTQDGSWDEPLDREFTVKKGKVQVRYCETCGIYRPPRASHCRLCGNCVDGIDHHCSYLHNCVGKRNYFTFLTLLVTATIAAIYIVVFSALHFSLLCHHDSISFGRALQESPGAAVSFLLGIGVLPGMLFLLWYHCRLLLHNLTTIEQIRASASKNLWKARKRPDNPFAEDSTFSNILIASFGRPQFPSWVQAHKIDPPDRRIPNPALTDRKWWAWEKPL